MAVAHNEFKELDVVPILNKHHVIFDVKGFMERNLIDGDCKNNEVFCLN